jgi:hypothetical protein
METLSRIPNSCGAFGAAGVGGRDPCHAGDPPTGLTRRRARQKGGAIRCGAQPEYWVITNLQPLVVIVGAAVSALDRPDIHQFRYADCVLKAIVAVCNAIGACQAMMCVETVFLPSVTAEFASKCYFPGEIGAKVCPSVAEVPGGVPPPDALSDLVLP